MPTYKNGWRRPTQGVKAAVLMEKVGLSLDMMRRLPHEFCGGQLRRIAIAQALILDPKVIVADETVPTLDVSIKAQVCNLLLHLQQSPAFLVISHDMAVVERVRSLKSGRARPCSKNRNMSTRKADGGGTRAGPCAAQDPAAHR